MLPSELLCMQFYKKYCNTSYHIFLGEFAQFKLIRFNSSVKLIADFYFSIQEH